MCKEAMKWYFTTIKMNTNTTPIPAIWNDHTPQMQYPLPTNESPRNVARNERRHQISIASPFDADIVLRKVIEDRSSILALKRRAASNGVDLMFAKSRQRQLKMDLSQLDREIEELVARAKTGIEEFNTACKEYISAFTLAFDDGDIQLQPRLPFPPSTQKLEAVVSKRKAIFIEIAQVDDRVKNLKFAELQNRVPKTVMKMNEQAFTQAVNIAKFQFSDSCAVWLSNVKDLLTEAHSVKERASATIDKQAKKPPTPKPKSNHQQLLSQKIAIDSPGRLSLKRPLDLHLSREQHDAETKRREQKKQRQDVYPIVLGHQPQFDLPSSNDEYRVPHQIDKETRGTQGYEKVQDLDSDEASIAKMLILLGR